MPCPLRVMVAVVAAVKRPLANFQANNNSNGEGVLLSRILPVFNSLQTWKR